jgi:hypothetical protein
LAYNFPNSPTVGQIYQGYTWDGEKWTASQTVSAVLKKNYILNSAMMISQENGGAAVTANASFPADQFMLSFSNTGTQTAQIVASVTPGGSPNRLRITATVPDTTVAAGDVCRISTPLEGIRVADLKLGLASAKTITIQFGVKAPAGTYCVALVNGASNRSYVAEYVIAAGEANTDVVKSVTVALDTTGTWAKDTTAGLSVSWALMMGSTYQTTANTWAAGLFLSTANQFNFMGTANNVFELFDVSLTEGTVAPPFVVPDYASEWAACQRYYCYGRVAWDGAVQSGQSLVSMMIYFPVTMRAVPSFTTGSIGATNLAGAGVQNAYLNGAEFYHLTNAVGNASFIDAWFANARM